MENLWIEWKIKTVDKNYREKDRKTWNDFQREKDCFFSFNEQLLNSCYVSYHALS